MKKILIVVGIYLVILVLFSSLCLKNLYSIRFKEKGAYDRARKQCVSPVGPFILIGGMINQIIKK